MMRLSHVRRDAIIYALAVELFASVATLRADPTAQTPAVAELTSGMPGPKGQPPAEIIELVPPIKILDANGFGDGGTTYVHLQDSRGAQLILCVTQDSFESPIEGNSLMIGGRHSDSPSARFPLNLHEAKLVIVSLEQALNGMEENSDGNDTANSNADPLEVDEDSKWRVRFAQQALRKIKGRAEFQLADPAELAARTKRLESVDLTSESELFRKNAGSDRQVIWQRLGPVLLGELKSVPPPERRVRIAELLGPSEAEAESRCSRPFPPPTRPTAHVAYNLFSDGHFFRDLVFSFDEQGNLDCEVLAIAGPRTSDNSVPAQETRPADEYATPND